MQLLSKKQLPRIKHRTAALVYFFLSGFGYATWASRIPTIQQHLHLNEAELGTALLAAPVGIVVTVPFTSNLLSRYSSKSIMILGGIGYSIVLSSLSVVSNLSQLWLALFCFGSSRNLLNVSMNAQGVEVQRLYERSITTSFHAVWSMAGFTGAAVGYLFVASGLPLTVHFASVSIFMILLSVAFYPNIYYTLQQMPGSKKFFTFPAKHMIVFSLIAFASMACENVMYDWSVIYFKKAVFTSKETATAALVVYMVCITTGRFLGDKLVPKFGTVNILKYSGILIFTGLITASLFPYVIPAGIGFALTGFGVCCIIPLIFTLAARSSAMSSGTAIASVSTISYLGFLAVPPGVGFVAQAIGLRWSFGLTALFGAAIFFLVFMIKEEKKA